MLQQVPADTAKHYERVQGYQAEALTSVLELWRTVSPSAISESWAEAQPYAEAAVASSQISAAESALIGQADTMVATGQYASPVAFVDPEGFAGLTNEGTDLSSALHSPVIRAKQAIAGGAAPALAVRSVRDDFDRIVRSLVSDAGRQAAAADMAAHQAGGYVRMLNPPSCKRCTIQAGRWFRWNAGFARHP